MKTTNNLLTILLCLFCLFLGFAGARIFQQKKDTPKIYQEKIDTFKKKMDSVSTQKPASAANKINTDYSKILKGKFVLDGAEYAGFDFIDSKTITWTNEIFPMDPDSMRLKWIDEKTFVTTFARFISKDCPPRNWVRKVEYYDGKKLIIKNFWTGWNDSKDYNETFYKE